MLPVIPICPALYHTLYPYALTIIEGGWFTWAKQVIIVQCPKGEVWVKVSKDNVIVKRVRVCPMHKEGDVFLFSEFISDCSYSPDQKKM
jgi:hypothetical protein